MHHPRPGRLAGFSYLGLYRYFVTIGAKRPGEPFTSAAVVAHLLAQLRQQVAESKFALVAYCFMPDHVHLVLEGLSESSDLRCCLSRWKQASGYWFKQHTNRPLWLSGYHDHVLRDKRSTMDFVGYVLRNPVRARLARRIGEYPFAGSDVYGQQELDELFRTEQD